MSKSSFGNPALSAALSKFATTCEPVAFESKHAKAVQDYCQLISNAHQRAGTSKVRFG